MRGRPRRAALPALLFWALSALLPGRVHSFKPLSLTETKRDAKRFGLDKVARRKRRPPHPGSVAAFNSFKKANGRGWRVRFDPRTGRPAAVVGGVTRRLAGPPDQAARQFLAESRELLGIDPSSLEVERQNSSDGHRHVLYRQTYRGLPVEFARVKVHLDDKGGVTGVHSGFEPDLTLDVNPAIGAAQAAEAAARDLGVGNVSGGELVIYPNERTGKAHLAWKLSAAAPTGRWRYYVDAGTGEVLFRYATTRFLSCPAVCLTSGTVSGLVYDIDPITTPGPVTRPFNNERVYVVDGSTYAVTHGDPLCGPGFFCSGTFGKIFTQLQGPYVSVSSFRGASAHYDNGNGVWSTVFTPISSPHPYSNSTIVTSTINVIGLAPTAVKVMPVFNSLKVGAIAAGLFGEVLDFADNDDVQILDGQGNSVASYVGSLGSFNGAAVPGTLLRLRLRANAAGTNDGFDVLVSSFLTLSNPTVPGYGSFTWTPASHTALGLRAEINTFYHLNQMREFFLNGVDKSSAAFLNPVAAMVLTGPSMGGAFYDPELDTFFFGDLNFQFPSDQITDDATVPHHEFTHYVVEKIWPIQNFGQAGAISEGNADYFSATSLNFTSIGFYFLNSFGIPGALRELDCPGKTTCRVLGTNQFWAGEIHEDSIFVSQSEWDIRKARVTAQGPVHGQACADGLVFQSLFFYPESFDELLDAILRVDAAGSVPACAQSDSGPPPCGGFAPGCVQGTILTAFAAHGIPVGAGTADPWDTAGGAHNDGFETAVDISTFGSVSATIQPATDVDFFTFAAGPGLIQLELNLPPDNGFFKAYMMTLFDHNRRLVAQGPTEFDGLHTNFGVCDVDDCTTTQSPAVLEFNNPAGGQFYLQISGGPTIDFSNSGVNSPVPYVLIPTYPRPNAFLGGVVTARFDNDRIRYNVDVGTFPRTQDLHFAYAQLRDHEKQALPQTDSRSPGFLTLASSASALGRVFGELDLQPGFAARFPALGTVYLEVFGYNVVGSTFSLGLSNRFNLTADRTDVHAWNNVFNPTRGERTTVKFELLEGGHLDMKLYTMNGNFVQTLFDADVPPGKGAVDWFGRNEAGNVVASGIYLLKVRGPGLDEVRKIAVVK